LKPELPLIGGQRAELRFTEAAEAADEYSDMPALVDVSQEEELSVSEPVVAVPEPVVAVPEPVVAVPMVPEPTPPTEKRSSWWIW
jgi:hypothetical protein